MGLGILLIEDGEILAKNIKRYFERRGYEVLIAGTAADGFRVFNQSELDLVLLDLNLPDLHGLKVLEEIRRRDPRVKIVCVTGHGSVQTAVDAMKGGAYDYVVKPVILSELKNPGRQGPRPGAVGERAVLLQCARRRRQRSRQADRRLPADEAAARAHSCPGRGRAG